MSRSTDTTGALLEPVRDEARRLDATAFGAAPQSAWSDVVVHTGPRSARLAEQQHAAAFTVGRHVVFNQDRYDPGSARGRALLAHELTHVQQQRRGGGDLDAGFRMPGSALARHSGAGEAHASAVGHGEAAGTGGATSVGIARQDKTAEAAQATEMLEFRDADGSVRRVSRAEGERLIGEACKKIAGAAVVVSDAAQYGRQEHKSYLDQYHSDSLWDVFTSGDKLVAAASSMAGDVVPPTLSIWTWPEKSAKRAAEAAQRGDLRTAARELRRANEEQGDAQRTWREFRQGSIAGAEKLVGELRPVAYVGMGMVQGVLGEVAQLADSALWVVDKAVELNGPGLVSDAYGAVKGIAREHGLVDENNGALSVSGVVHKKLDAVHDEIADPMADPAAFDLWDVSQLGGSVALQAGLAAVGATEVKLALKVLGGVGVAKAISDRVDAHTDKQSGAVDVEALVNDPDFLVALGGAVVYLAGFSKSRVGDKLVRRLLLIAPSALSGTRELVRLGEAYAMPASTDAERRERDEAIKTAMLGLARVAADALLTSVKSDPSGKGLPKEGAAKGGASTGGAPKGEAPKGETPKSGGAPKTEGAAKTESAPATSAQTSATKPKVFGPPAPVPTGPALENTVAPPAAKTAAPQSAPAAKKAAAQKPTAVKKAKTSGPAKAASPPKAAAAMKAEAPATPKTGTLSDTAAAAKASAKASPKKSPKTPSEKSTAKKPTTAKKSTTAKKATAKKDTAKKATAKTPTEAAPSVAGKAAPKNDSAASGSKKSVPKKSAQKKGASKRSATKSTPKKAAAAKKTTPAQKKAPAAKKSPPNKPAGAKTGKTPAEVARSQWPRRRLRRELGARPHEEVHHAIELDVLNQPEFEGAFTAKELNDAANMRVIPLEVSSSEAALLDTARSTPRASWPKEVRDAVEMTPVHAPVKGGPTEVPTLRDRSSAGREKVLHGREIRAEWDRQYDAIKAELAKAQAQGKLLPGSPERVAFVRQQVMAARDYIDFKYGSFWGQAKRGAGLR